MALQLLDNLLGLEVPYVDAVVLAPAHDPLSARHAKVGKYAELVVLVPRVRLEALARVVVPQP